MTVRRLLIDGLTIGSPGGLMLQHELSMALERTKPQGASVVLVMDARRPPIEAGALGVRAVPAPAGWRGRLQWLHAGLPAMLRQERADALFALTGHLSARAARCCGIVSTVNNMLPFTPALLRQLPVFGAARIKMLLIKRAYVASLARADTVVLHSGHALAVLAREVPDLAAKTAVVLTGVPSTGRLPEGALPPHPHDGRPYFFYLSTMHPYKNHMRLIEAYEMAVREAGASLPDMVIAGIPADAGYVARVRERIAAAGLGERIRYYDDLTREALPAWVTHAHANVFPSLCETNSIVQAEILGMRGVMACSDLPPMNEVAGDAAVLFDPLDTNAMASMLTRVAADAGLREQLRAKGAERLRALSWDECGRVIWQQADAAASRYEARHPRG